MRKILKSLKYELTHDVFLAFLCGLNLGILIAFCILFFEINVFADETSVENVIYEEVVEEVSDPDISDGSNQMESEITEESYEESESEVLVDEVIENNEVEENVSNSDNSVIDQSDPAADQQSDLPGANDPVSGTEIESPYDLPEVGGVVDRDDNGALYISEETPDLQNKIDLYEDLLSTEKVDVFSEELIGSEDLTDWDIADYFKAVVTQALFDIFGDPSESEEEVEEEHEILLASDERLMVQNVLESPFLSPIASLANSTNRSGYKNVVVYHGTFNNYDVDLIVPYDKYSSLLVQSGYLVNVGSSSVTGKFLYGDDPLDPSDYDSYTYIMDPIYGSTSNVFNYGSFNHRRHYFLTNYGTSERITYDDMYGNFFVNDVDVYYQTSERVYYVLLVIILLMGVSWIWKLH